MLGCIIVTYFCFPETKGRTPAELDEMFEARIPARQFNSMYSCIPQNSQLANKVSHRLCMSRHCRDVHGRAQGWHERDRDRKSLNGIDVSSAQRRKDPCIELINVRERMSAYCGIVVEAFTSCPTTFL
jgi:hypothetical protein